MLVFSKLIQICFVVGILAWAYPASAQETSFAPWKVCKLPRFAFSCPSTWKLISEKGRDSAIWELHGDGVEILFDLGIYSEFPNVDRSEPGYNEEAVIIDGKRAMIVSFEDHQASPIRYSIALYFLQVDDSTTKLSVQAEIARKSDEIAVRKLFHSIKFSRYRR